MKNKTIIAVILTIVAVAVVSVTPSLAQPIAPPPPPGGGGPPCWPPPCIPIDGGISLLVAAGLALGGRKLIKSETKKAE